MPMVPSLQLDTNGNYPEYLGPGSDKTEYRDEAISVPHCGDSCREREQQERGKEKQPKHDWVIGQYRRS
jgi:hypothetical protein